MYKFISFCIMALLLGCSTPPTARDVLFKAKNGSVRILTADGNPNGSGFYTKTPAGNTVVVTNDHVCDGLKPHMLLPLSLDAITLPPFTAIPILSKQQVDLCAFKLSPLLQAVIKPLPIAKAPLKLYDRVFVLGYPALQHMSIAEGLVLADVIVEVAGRDTGRCIGRREPFLFFGMICIMKYNLIETSATTIGGNSGSPALNENGEVVGVYNSADQRTNYGNYVKLEDLKAFLLEVDSRE